MIDGLKAYPAYKDSGVCWLGKVPKHWQVRRLRNAVEMRVSNVDKHTKDGEHPVRLCNYVDVYKNDRIDASMAFMRATATPGEIERFRLKPGDVLITKDSEAWDDIGVPALVEQSADDLICGYHLALLRPRGGLLCGGYLLRALQSKGVAHQFHVEANGVTRFGLSHAAIKSIWLPVPPLPEQAVIVRFLDHADRLIRRYIRTKKKLIALLNEQKQAIVHQAVTLGLDPNAGRKPSGIEWLGDVPEHWNVRKLRQCGTIMGGMTPSMSVRRYWDGTVPWVTPKDMKRFTIGDSIVKLTEHAVRETSIRLIEPPAVLLVVRGMILARRVPVALSIEHVTINQDMKALNPFSGISAEFLARSLDSAQTAFFPLIDEAGHGTRRLPTERWRNLAVAIPPENEQAEILDFINANTRQLDAAIDRAHSEITLLQEFRGTLIADVVTGKIDVREAAARLPDEDEDPEPLDGPEEPLEDGEAFDEVAMEAGAS